MITDNILTVTPNNGYSGEIVITVTVSDGILTDSTQFILTVIPNNIPGDLDLNGYVNVADIVLLVNWILNDISNEVGDVDQSGSINVADIVLIVSIILNS